MSLRNNKASRLNRYMMFGTLLLAVVVLGCVFAFLYMAFPSTGDNASDPKNSISSQDSIVFIVNDSTLLDSI